MFCLRIFNHFIYIGDYSAVIHQRILYVILPQITQITLIFLLLSPCLIRGNVADGGLQLRAR